MQMFRFVLSMCHVGVLCVQVITIVKHGLQVEAVGIGLLLMNFVQVTIMLLVQAIQETAQAIQQGLRGIA